MKKAVTLHLIPFDQFARQGFCPVDFIRFAHGSVRSKQIESSEDASQAINLGRQRLHLLTPEAAFRVIALTDGIADYECHLRSLLSLTPLRAIQWVNLARNRVQLKSLVK